MTHTHKYLCTAAARKVQHAATTGSISRSWEWCSSTASHAPARGRELLARTDVWQSAQCGLQYPNQQILLQIMKGEMKYIQYIQ